MNLRDYIASLGTANFAKRYNVSPRTVEAWRQGRRRPIPKKAEEIIASSAVTWEGIYRPGGEKTAARGMRPTLKARRHERLY